MVCSSTFERFLFSAAFSIAFHGCFRVGELTYDKRKSQRHYLKLADISFSPDAVIIFLKSSKTDQAGTGSKITLNRKKGDPTCPVSLLSSYSDHRPQGSEILFTHFDGSPLTGYQFSAILKKSLAVLGIDHTRYTSHSFRIGSATNGFLGGLSESDIKELGRWKSKAYTAYIRS
ncbi:hypothetical protein SNE40_021041 [Patella caerulea]